MGTEKVLELRVMALCMLAVTAAAVLLALPLLATVGGKLRSSTPPASVMQSTGGSPALAEPR